MADNIGRQISEERALEPMQAAQILYKSLFERGGGKPLSPSDRFIAVGTITAGLIEWKKQILAAQEGEAEKWKKRYTDAKAELDDVRLKLAILQKEA